MSKKKRNKIKQEAGLNNSEADLFSNENSENTDIEAEDIEDEYIEAEDAEDEDIEAEDAEAEDIEAENAEAEDIEAEDIVDDEEKSEAVKVNDSSQIDEEKDNKAGDSFKKHIAREAILDQIYEDNGFKKDDVIREQKEKTPFKALAVFSLVLAVAGLALIGVLVYFIILNPYYIKSGAADEQLIYPMLSSDTDAEELSEPLVTYGATDTDAMQDISEEE